MSPRRCRTSPSRAFAAATTIAALALLAAGPRADDTPADPTSSAAVSPRDELAARLARLGTDRVLLALCDAGPGPSLEHDAAFVTLVGRAPTAVPLLLALAGITRKDQAMYSSVAYDLAECAAEAIEVLAASACGVPGVRDDESGVTRSPAVIERQQRATQRALLAALTQTEQQQSAALAVIEHIRLQGVRGAPCKAADQLLERATPTLADMLAGGRHAGSILALFAAGGTTKALAVPAIERYLADPAHLPQAVKTLAALNVEMPQVAPALAALLYTTEAPAALEALLTLRPAARAQTASDLASLAARLDPSCELPVSQEPLVRALTDLTGLTDQASAVSDGLTHIVLHCPGLHLAAAADALARLGAAPQSTLLAELRSPDRTIDDRLAIASALQRHRASLSAADRALIERLSQKATRSLLEPRSSGRRAPPPRANASFAACRAEVGLSPRLLPGLTDEQQQELGTCLDDYLCGPELRAYERTLDRCCAVAFSSDQRPAACRP